MDGTKGKCFDASPRAGDWEVSFKKLDDRALSPGAVKIRQRQPDIAVSARAHLENGELKMSTWKWEKTEATKRAGLGGDTVKPKELKDELEKQKKKPGANGGGDKEVLVDFLEKLEKEKDLSVETWKLKWAVTPGSGVTTKEPDLDEWVLGAVGGEKDDLALQ